MNEYGLATIAAACWAISCAFHYRLHYNLQLVGTTPAEFWGPGV